MADTTEIDDAIAQLDLSGDTHGTPTEGMECMATMEDITVEDGNYAEYQTAPSGTWHPSGRPVEGVGR